MVLLLTWIVVLGIVIWLPSLVRSMNLGEQIDASMQRTIRAVLIGTLIVGVVAIACQFFVGYVSGFQFWLRG